MNSEELLIQGINILCKENINIDNLISPRREEIISALNRYIKEIETFNPAYGLVGTDNIEELIIKHILDSLAPLGIISRFLNLCASVSQCEPLPDKIRIADAGSGAGLPGIPLAIALNQCDFTLIERMKRRTGFLFNTKAVLPLSNITIEESELENVQCAPFDLITFRAFKPMEPKLLKTLFKVCKKGGIIAAYKGKYQKIEAEMAVFQSKTEWEAIPYAVPFLDEERNILAIKTE
ncbi:MAG: 16S rRNA (guanine(527)-N(7))-methyltransferase RsmG [Treponema sp.]|nr:16S rRNA (guanine(527)-N(7))-methyltransferase RsmG [Treponema sp.]